jgi:hypothetical protein
MVYSQNLLHVISTICLYGFLASHGPDFAWAQETNSATSSIVDPYDYRNINGTYAAPVDFQDSVRNIVVENDISDPPFSFPRNVFTRPILE